ncbi:hypothetical protein C5167_036255 [Papaver somniferum]|nr:hypothetical protein C5167_036255 [Papaver somniferum]
MELQDRSSERGIAQHCCVGNIFKTSTTLMWSTSNQNFAVLSTTSFIQEQLLQGKIEKLASETTGYVNENTKKTSIRVM